MMHRGLNYVIEHNVITFFRDFDDFDVFSEYVPNRSITMLVFKCGVDKFVNYITPNITGLELENNTSVILTKNITYVSFKMCTYDQRLSKNIEYLEIRVKMSGQGTIANKSMKYMIFGGYLAYFTHESFSKNLMCLCVYRLCRTCTCTDTKHVSNKKLRMLCIWDNESRGMELPKHLVVLEMGECCGSVLLPKYIRCLEISDPKQKYVLDDPIAELRLMFADSNHFANDNIPCSSFGRTVLIRASGIKTFDNLPCDCGIFFRTYIHTCVQSWKKGTYYRVIKNVGIDGLGGFERWKALYKEKLGLMEN